MKRLLALLLSLAVIAGAASGTSAETPADAPDYETAVAEIMRGYDKDPAAARAALAGLDAALLGEPERAEGRSAGGTIGGTADYTLTVYAVQRGGDANCLLQWRLDCHKAEANAGSLDLVGLEWDTAYGRYYSAGGDGAHSSVAGRSEGVVLFNLEDEELRRGGWSQGSVYVTPQAAGEMAYGAKLTHSYTVKPVETVMGYTFAPSDRVGGSLGLPYTYSYTVTTNVFTSAWSLWTGNAVAVRPEAGREEIAHE